MNKALIFMTAVLLFAFFGAVAEEQYFTICEIHDYVMEALPDGWQESISTQWRTVEIKTPVLVPDVDSMPVLALRVNTDDMLDLSVLPGNGWSMPDKDQRTPGYIKVSRKADESKPDYSRMKIRSDHYYTPVDMNRCLSGFQGRSLQKLADEIRIPLELAACGRYTWDFSHPYDVMVNVYTDEASGASIEGYVNYLVYQTIEGIPLISHIGDYLPYDLPRWENRLWPRSLMMGLDAYGGMSFLYGQLEGSVIADDVPLAGFERVCETLRRAVEDGHIRKILQMRLGYAVMDLNDLDSNASGYRGVTRPIWHADVWWLRKGTSEMKADDPEYETNDYGKMECARIAIDAQTGEIIGIAGSSAPEQKKNAALWQYNGYPGWKDVRGK